MLEKLSEFNYQVMKQTSPETPSLPSSEKILQLLALIDEERAELAQAVAKKDLVEVYDALGDMVVVIQQFAILCGKPEVFSRVLEEIHRSNMSKVGGEVNEAGKFIKPSSYKPVDINTILQKEGYQNV